MKLFRALLILLALTQPAYAKVQEIKTPQGFTIWLVEEHSLPIIAANITFTQSGTAYDPKELLGRANMTVGLLMEGAGSRNSEAFNDTLENNAIHLSMGLDEDIMGASLETLSEHKDIAFSLMSDAIIRPRFDDEAIARIRAKTLSLLVSQSESPYYKLERSWQQHLYGDHPYGNPELGAEASVKALTKEQMQAYHARYFSKQNIIISIAGDITAAEATKIIDEKFAGLTAQYQPDTTLADVTFPKECGTHITAHDMPQTMVRFGMSGIKRKDSDYMTAYVLNHIIGGGGLGSILSREIRMKHGLVYSVSSQLLPYDYAASWGGMFATQHEQARNAVEELKKTLAAVKKNGISASQLNDAKAFLTGSFILNLDSNIDLTHFLTLMQRFSLGSDYIDKRNDIVNAINLTDINRVANRLLAAENLCIIAVGKGEL